MKFCSECGSALRASVENLGLTQYVAPNGEEARRRFIKQQEDGVITADSFDPLMQSAGMVMNAILSRAPLLIITGECPVCYVVGHATGAIDPDTNEEWTADQLRHHYLFEPVKAVKKFAIDEGFVPRVVQ